LAATDGLRQTDTLVTRARAIALLVVGIGVLGTVQVIRDRESDTQFIAQQQSLVPIGARQLAQLIARTRDPRPGHGAGRARGAVCRPFGAGQLRNPWTCVVTYPTSPTVRYRVTVASDRSIQGQNPALSLSVRGCCVAQAP
jgi:hypothetical protein